MQDNRRTQSNSGSTFVMVVIAIAFITVLATLIMGLAAMNVQLRNQDVDTKKTFYTAEEAVDEVYVNLGMVAMDEFANSYQKVASNINYEVSVGGSYVTTVKSNAEYNEMMKETFVEYALNSITGNDPHVSINGGLFDSDTMDSTDRTNMLEAVKTNLLGAVNARIESIESVEAYSDYNNDEKYYILVKNIVIFYKESSSKQYFSEVTIDLKLEYPDVDIAFVPDNTDKLATYNDYCLIGNTGIYFKDSNRVVINDGIFGGTVNNTLTSGGITLENSGVTVNGSNIVSGGNINIVSSTDNSNNITPTLWASNSNIWAVNMNLNKENDTLSCAPVLAITGASNSYIKDDTTANASNSSVSIGGSYWGYGNNALQTGSHVNNSAIIVNGNRSNVNLTALQDLLLAGRAYIVYDGAALYGTGESLALRNSQEIYLVHKGWVKVTNTNDSSVREMNPVVLENYKTGTGINIQYNYSVDETNVRTKIQNDFYGIAYLHADLYEKVKVEGKYECYYYKFKDTAAAAEFFKITMNDTYASSKGVDVDDPVRQELKTRVSKKIKEFTGSSIGSVGISVASGGTVSTTGYLLTVTNGGVAGIYEPGNNNQTPAFVSRLCQNFNNRYNVMTKYLFDFDKIEIDAAGNISNEVTNFTPSTLTSNGITYAVDPVIYNQTLFENLIIRDVVNEVPITNVTPNANGLYVYVNNLGGGGTYKVPSSAKSGIIIVDNGHVELDHSFSGLIICNGQIKVKSSDVTYDNNIVYNGINYTLEAFIESYEGGLLKPYFYSHSEYAIGVSPSENIISKLQYYDLIAIQNWRKTEKE